MNDPAHIATLCTFVFLWDKTKLRKYNTNIYKAGQIAYRIFVVGCGAGGRGWGAGAI